ncbi:MAG: VOC family protein [Inhella sp.]
MARVSTYLNFPSQCEQAFNFYRSVFGGEFEGGIHRFGDMPPNPACPPASDADKNLVMHVSLPIFGGAHVLMGSDAPASMGFDCKPGNALYISLHPDTRADTDRLFMALAEGGKVETPLQDMFWGAYFGSLTDKFGIQWMFNCEEAK